MPQKDAKPANDLYSLQEKWLLACAEFDQAKSGPKQRTAVGRMQRVLRSLQTAHPRELGAYRTAYERRLEKMAGVKLPRSAERTAPRVAGAAKSGRQSAAPKKKAAGKRR
jgi:hypothetical protein